MKTKISLIIVAVIMFYSINKTIENQKNMAVNYYMDKQIHYLYVKKVAWLEKEIYLVKTLHELQTEINTLEH